MEFCVELGPQLRANRKHGKRPNSLAGRPDQESAEASIKLLFIDAVDLNFKLRAMASNRWYQHGAFAVRLTVRI